MMCVKKAKLKSILRRPNRSVPFGMSSHTVTQQFNRDAVYREEGTREARQNESLKIE